MRFPPVVLVTDGEQRAALAITRSLGRAGYRVVVTSPRSRSLAGSSRHAWDRRPTPDPLVNPEGFLHALEAAASENRADVILPVTDQSLGPVLASRSRFAGARVPFPDSETWRRAGDKAYVLGEASRLGIPVPHQIVLQASDRDQMPELPMPAVIKPSRSVVVATDRQTRFGVRHVSTREQLRDALTALPAEAFPVLIQQRVAGPGLGVFLLMHDGVVLAAFGHRRVLEKPPSGGVSVCSESVRVAPELLEASASLLRALGWSGVAMVEYKQDRTTGTAYLMEVNGRFWGSLQLAVDAGVDFPRMLVDHALGRAVSPVLSWDVGRRSRWRLGEVDHLLARVRRPSAGGDLPPWGRSLAHALLPAWHPRRRGEVFRWSDPLPGLVELSEWLRGR